MLALSGGGYRGLYTAKVLELLEQKSGAPVARHFDLICGTSIGGIIALALALEISASKIVEIFIKEGESIFGGRPKQRRLREGRWWDSIWPLGMNRAIHTQDHLRKVLERPEFFGNHVLGECSHPVIVPSVNFTTAVPQFFKTSHHPLVERDHALALIEIALATSAAPVYFPQHRFNNKVYVDGGLVANGPALFGVHEAECFLNHSPNDIHVLAIGTLQIDSTASAADRLDRGIRAWGKDLFTLTIAAQERAMNQIVAHRLGKRFMSINDTLTQNQVKDVSLDLADEQARQTLLGRADNSYQLALKEGVAIRFLTHIAPTPRFFHGSRAPTV
ncbi:MAG: patatin-like phospholipase family protein [Burkholderiales bacterium]|nr:patatin-like phospholipase family protein [Burkholderiales bacterium]